MPSLSKIGNRVFYGWVVIFAGVLMLSSTLGIRHSFGVFFKSIELEFSLSRGATSSIFSIYMIISAVVAVMGGWVLDRYGTRIAAISIGLFTALSLLLTAQAGSAWQLFISYSLLLSLGTGAAFTVVSSTISRWFVKNRGFALGITQSGGALGTVVMAPFATYLISNFDWRTALVVIGIIVFIVITAISVLLRHDPADIGLMPDGARSEVPANRPQNKEDYDQKADLTLLEASKTWDFWSLGIIWLLAAVSIHLITTHTVPYAIDKNITPMDAAVIISIITGISIPARLIIGKYSDIVGRKMLAVASSLLQVCALLWLIWANNVWMFYLFGVAFGISWGGLTTVTTALISDIFGTRNIGTIMGVMSGVWSIGAAIGPALGGFTFDVTGNYFVAFITTATAMLITTLLVILTGRKTIKTY